jgi:hypothetical protein
VLNIVIRGKQRVGEAVCGARIDNAGNPRAGVGGAQALAGEVVNYDLILCGAAIYAEQSSTSRWRRTVDQSFLHII